MALDPPTNFAYGDPRPDQLSITENDRVQCAAKGMTGDARQYQRQAVRQFLHRQGFGLPQVKKRRRVGKPDAATE